MSAFVFSKCIRMQQSLHYVLLAFFGLGRFPLVHRLILSVPIYIETSIYSCWSFSSVACLNSFVLLLWYRMLMLELFIHPVGTLWRFFTKSCLSVYCFKKPLVLITRWYYAISFFQRAMELDVTFYDRLKNFLYVVNVMKCGINFVIYEVFNLFICLFE